MSQHRPAAPQRPLGSAAQKSFESQIGSDASDEQVCLFNLTATAMAVAAVLTWLHFNWFTAALFLPAK